MKSNSIKGVSWKTLDKGARAEKRKAEDIVDILLENRELKTKGDKESFLNPKKPAELSLKDFGIQAVDVKKAIKRISKAIKDKEKVIVYGDYDADGICATAIVWEALYKAGVDITPYIPDRFSDGYGLNAKSIKNLKQQTKDLKLIITVDNGIVAKEAVNAANKLGIDVIITDHHEKGRGLPGAHSIIHTKATSGSGIAWVFAREFYKAKKKPFTDSLELAAIGTVADQLQLIGINRSIAKFGLEALGRTKRVGLIALLQEAGIKDNEIETYVINFVIAPRINAMGRLGSGMDSLRLLCTKNVKRASDLSKLLGRTNQERQKITENVITHAKELAVARNSFIVVADASYHEGVIGLAAGKLVEEYFRPAIVIAVGEEISKASARSIPGVNLIKALRELEGMLVAVGGHEMAAGFSIKTKDIDLFTKRLEKLAKKYLKESTLQKTLKIDTELIFPEITYSLCHSLKKLAPFGQGNPTPTFVSKDVEIAGARLVGKDGSHLKLKLKKDDKYFDAIGFGLGGVYKDELRGKTVDIAYAVEENIWNGNISLQMKLKDLAI